MKVPSKGDVVWLSMGRHEQADHRPHLVLSNEILAQTMGLVIAVPMTTTYRPWATRIALANGSYAIGEQPRTFSVSHITKIEKRGYDVEPVVRVIRRLLED
ncbi:MAG: type II toxin-antitoxin system PemK/MazF family toxin [Ancrocorticia sp.]